MGVIIPKITTKIPDINRAAGQIASFAKITPILTCEALNGISKTKLYFKCENFQKTGAFKFRGACNAVFRLSAIDAAKGVATHSSGNHAAALALAGNIRGISVHVVMPENAPKIKIRAVENYGAIITFCKPTLKARESTLKKVIDRTGAVEIHPYNNEHIIAGQGTVALELIQKIPDLEIIIAPVGGGGLLSGTSIAVKRRNPSVSIIGAEPAGADDACQSLKKGEIIPQTNPQTIADGLLTSLGDKTFPIIQKYVSEILTVSERNIIYAMSLIWERMKIIVEPSAAVPLGAILENKGYFKEKKVGVILSGGNVDFSGFFASMKEN